MNKLTEFAKLVREAERGVAFTGAGISTESGIPDYRGPQGVWNTETPVYYQDFMASRQARVRAWQGGVRVFHRGGAARAHDRHPTTRSAACQHCGKEWPTPVIVERVEKGDEAPECDACGGPIKARTISF